MNGSARTEVGADRAGGQGLADRPLRADARRNRARVLQAAAEAFAAEGPAVPLDEIARRAGVGAGTVYRHFPTKEELLAAVLIARMETMLAEVRAALAEPDPGPAFYRFFLTMTVDAQDKMDLAEALTSHGIDIRAATAGIAGELKGALADLLRRAQEAGEVRPDVNVEDLHALVIGAIAAARAAPSGDVPRVAGLVADGLRPRLG
ncbi:AcrR family transcriptional regulator [Catenulispora sp. MAP12-49]|uniref:TetR/AcrR family transcriptional regulator n=1 Tax=Catenulispora sp. MAP12-49 TaxID=3156302 RepID=UPI0035153A04